VREHGLAFASSTRQQLYSVNNVLLKYAPDFIQSLFKFIHVIGACLQRCDLETMVSRLECTRVHFVQVSVSVSRPEVQGLGLGLET